MKSTVMSGTPVSGAGPEPLAGFLAGLEELVAALAGRGEEDAVLPDDRRRGRRAGQLQAPAHVLVAAPADRQAALGAGAVDAGPAPVGIALEQGRRLHPRLAEVEQAGEAVPLRGLGHEPQPVPVRLRATS
mgnify:CR=1 FL=1